MSFTPIILNPDVPVSSVIRPLRIPPEPSDEKIGDSLLGTPVYSNLVFNADPDTPENQDIRLDDVIMEVSQFRNIVTTPVAGRDGTVKEYISDNDYQIVVRGLVVSQYPKVRPDAKITALKNVFNLKKEISVTSSFLNLFEVTDVVVVSYRFREAEGVRNVVPFDVTLISETPIEIQVNA